MSSRHPHYWDRYVTEDGRWIDEKRPPGEDLSALRRGLGREPGTVPELWRFHQVSVPEDQVERGWLPNLYEGEHHALTLFGVHQQSAGPTSAPVHKPGIGVGTALRALHLDRGGKGAEASKAIDRRFYAAVTATTRAEAAHHLRGLIRMLRSRTKAVPLDYTQLVADLSDWGLPERRDRVRRRWGLQYHSSVSDAAPTDDPSEAEPAATTN